MTSSLHVTSITDPPGSAATPWTRGQAADLLARSFQHQPHFVDLFPNPRVRARALPHVFAALCRDARQHGRVHVATRDGHLAGIVVWYPPWTYPLSPGRQMASLPDIARMALAASRSVARVMRFQSAAADLHPDQPYWYLAAIGVDPDAQGAGIGTRLLEPGLAEADAAGRDCYLETHTPRLVAWYQRLGFATRHGEVAFTPGGPPNWTMLRRAGQP